MNCEVFDSTKVPGEKGLRALTKLHIGERITEYRLGKPIKREELVDDIFLPQRYPFAIKDAKGRNYDGDTDSMGKFVNDAYLTPSEAKDFYQIVTDEQDEFFVRITVTCQGYVKRMEKDMILLEMAPLGKRAANCIINPGWVMAACPIDKGEELLTSYGLHYWTHILIDNYRMAGYFGMGMELCRMIIYYLGQLEDKANRDGNELLAKIAKAQKEEIPELLIPPSPWMDISACFGYPDVVLITMKDENDHQEALKIIRSGLTRGETLKELRRFHWGRALVKNQEAVIDSSDYKF
jgi:hypothetical protein